MRCPTSARETWSPPSDFSLIPTMKHIKIANALRELSGEVEPRGSGIIEIIIAIFIISTAFFAILQLSVMSLKASGERNNKESALMLAQEGIEGARTIRDAGWTANISSLSFGGTYYLVNQAGVWVLTATNPGLINNKFTRTIVIANVSRDINDNIVQSGGTNDVKTKKLTVTVSWGSPAKSVQLVTYITDILKN